MKKDIKINFWSEVKRRLTDPWKESAFSGYFVLTIILASVAIFTPLCDVSSGYTKAISGSIGTFFLASIVSSTLDLNLSFSIINKASFSIYTILALIISIALFVLTFILTDNWRLFPSLTGLLLSLFIWVIANSDKDIYNDEKHAKKMKESFTRTNNYQNLFNQISKGDE
jgi:membrane associated rhomboid family serine protease